MKQRPRRYYTTEQEAEIWDAYKRGESLNAIARLFDRRHSSIGGVLSRSGGIRPVDRCRSQQALSLEEREEISRGLAVGESMRSIAYGLGRAPSTVSREITRNGGLKKYRATVADEAAWDRAKRPKPCKLLLNRKLRHVVTTKLKRSWSPQQIAGWLARTHPLEPELHLSHETIYKTLYVQARGAFKKELIKCLRSNRAMRRSRTASLKRKGLGAIPNAVSISERPASAKDRAIPGHWEGDLIEGSNKTFIATLVERHSRYVMLVKVKDNKTETVINALIKQSKKLPQELYKSLTWDRGSELSGHAKFTVATDVDVFFCDPQSPWQRGSNENTNRLLREYFPKSTDLSVHSQAHMNKVARQLNERPRKTLEYETPAERFNACVAQTG